MMPVRVGIDHQPNFNNMKSICSFLFSIILFSACQTSLPETQVSSPSGNLDVSFFLKDGQAAYSISFNNTKVVDTSTIAFDIKDQSLLGKNLKIIAATTSAFSEKWEMPWGEQRWVDNNYNKLLVDLQETGGEQRKFSVEFRVYDDGLGFRYHFPKQGNVDEWIIMDELTEFQLTSDPTVWWIPGDWDIYEHLYNTSRFSEIDALSKQNHPNLASTHIPFNAVNTPVTMKSENGTYLSFHEADLTGYPGMTLMVDNESLKMTSELVGSAITGYKAKISLPFSTPWRTIHVADRAGDLIESNLIVNLNEPNQLGDVSWFTPMKYVGIWWEMHLGKSTWDMESSQSMDTYVGDEVGKAVHGATTENARRHIDFASENGIKGLLVEGWNTGWDHWIGFEDREGVFDFVTPYPDYDLSGIVDYANEKGVEIIMHHETSAAPRTYDQQKDTAYALMQSLGIHSVKTGYVGKIIPKGEYHHGQWMVNHYHGVLETAAKYEVAINAHEPIKATGKRRTYPNAISREGLRGQEFNSWSIENGNPPEHLTIVPFTRMLGGPIDFTPGIFNIKLSPYRDGTGKQVNTTLAHQLGLYVVIYSPIQMAADLIENYDNQPAFQFIRDVGVDWEQSKVLDGEVGEFVVIARQERETMNWFVGGTADEKGKTVSFSLDFLDDGVTYKGVLYKDASDSHWDENPTAIEIEEIKIKKGEDLTVVMAPGGGFALSLIK
jgi:hypothetical protein